MRRLVLLALLAGARLIAADITLTGGWSPSLSAGDLPSGAGSSVPASLESSASAASLTLQNTLTSVVYHVYAHISSASWPSGSTLWVRRTSDGSSLLPLATISGGTSYIPLTSTDTEIFIGLLDRSGITLQYKIDGLSLSVPPANYQVIVTYTILP